MILSDETIISFLQISSVPYEENIHLSAKTWIKRGGIGRFFIMPKDMEQMKTVVKYFLQNKTPFHVVGATSNIYIQNRCDLHIVISTLNVDQEEDFNDCVICGCGVNVTGLSRKMVKNGYAGYEGLVGLPGTVGGAIVNNSSAFGYSVCQMAKEIYCIDENGNDLVLSSDDLKLTAHSSAIKTKEYRCIVVGAKLLKKKGSVEDLKLKAEKYQKQRASLQHEIAMTLGSCFYKLSKSTLLTILLTVRFLTRKTIKIFCSKKVQEKRLERTLFYTLSGYHDLARYVDIIQPNCFIWRDEKADDVFFRQYLPFMKKYYKAEDLEIEIISDDKI